jgi:hypothetical protein
MLLAGDKVQEMPPISNLQTRKEEIYAAEQTLQILTTRFQMQA